MLRGLSDDIKTETVIGNTKAHMFLGNQIGLAPRLIALPDGRPFLKEGTYYYYLLEYVEGRQLLETIEDEYILGKASRELHTLEGYDHPCSFNSEEQKNVFLGWFSEHEFKKEYDDIINGLPNFSDYDQCFIHTDIGPHNAVLSNEGKVIFIDLDDAGIGSRYIDFGWPFIMQFVDYNKKTQKMRYRFDLAKAFLKGYYGDKNITKEELDMIWNGAVYMQISYMQCFGPEAVIPLWSILKFGMAQKKRLYDML